MKKQFSTFNHTHFGSIRTVMINGMPHFVGKDVAEALGFSHPSSAISTHCKGFVAFRLNSTGRPVNVIPESDLYRLIMRSKLPSAEAFQDWVCEEVLPSIRSNGGYIAGQEEETDPAVIMAKALQVANNVLEQKERQLLEAKEELTITAPKAALVDNTFGDGNSKLTPLPAFVRRFDKVNTQKVKQDLKRLGLLRKTRRGYRVMAKSKNYFVEKIDAKWSRSEIFLTKAGQLLMNRLYDEGELTLLKEYQ